MSMTGPLGFAQYFQLTNEPWAKYILMSFIKAEAVFTRLPMDTEGTLKKIGKRVTGNLPNITTVTMGQEPANPFVVPVEDYEEGAALIRDNFDIDELEIKDKLAVGGDIVRSQLDSYIEARTFYLNWMFFNNSRIGTTDPNGFIGIKYRLTNAAYFGLPGGLDLTNTSTAGTTTVDLSTSGMTGASGTLMERYMQMSLDHQGIPDGTGGCFFANPQVLRNFDQVVKGGGNSTTGTVPTGFTTTKDSFDRIVRKFRNADIVSCGYNAPGGGGYQTTVTYGSDTQTTPIIDSTQDVNGWSSGDPQYNPTGAVYSSMYLVRTGVKWLSSWQVEPPTVRRVWIPGTRKWRVMFDMTAGLYHENSRAVGRIHGIKTDGATGD